MRYAAWDTSYDYPRPTLRAGATAAVPWGRVNSIEGALERLTEVSASDLLLSCGSPPRIRKDGRLELMDPNEPVLTPADTERLLRDIIEPADWKILQKRRQVDFAFTWRDRARIRANAYYQRDSLAAALRLLPLEIPGFELLGMPESVHRLMLRQVHDPGRDPRPHQQDAASTHHHDRGPDRVHPQAPAGDRRPEAGGR